jgi:hypothetical protein
MYLVGAWQSQLAIAKDIVCTLVSFENVHSNRVMARMLGVEGIILKGG